MKLEKIINKYGEVEGYRLDNNYLMKNYFSRNGYDWIVIIGKPEVENWIQEYGKTVFYVNNFKEGRQKLIGLNKGEKWNEI